MHESVKSAFRPWITGKGPTGEGDVRYMYKDSKGYVTIGIGNKIDPISTASPWLSPNNFTHKHRKSFTRADVEKEWRTVRNVKNWRCHGDFESITNLRLTDVALTNLFNSKLNSIELNLKNRYREWFGEFDSWPADAQMGLLGLAWGIGEGGVAMKFKKFRQACYEWDFITAAAESHYQGESVSSRRRKADLKILFNNAAFVLYKNLPRGQLIFPQAKLAPIMFKPSFL